MIPQELFQELIPDYSKCPCIGLEYKLRYTIEWYYEEIMNRPAIVMINPTTFEKLKNELYHSYQFFTDKYNFNQIYGLMVFRSLDVPENVFIIR